MSRTEQHSPSPPAPRPAKTGWRAPRWLTLCAIWSLIPMIALLAGGDTVQAQTFNFDLGDGPGVTSSGRLIQLIGLITVLSIAPAILMMVTSFTRIIVVLSLLRTALGIQQSPPNQVLISLAMFLTLFIMMPTLERVWDEGLEPMINGNIDEFEGFERSVKPVHDFMMTQVRERDLQLFVNLAGVEVTTPETIPLRSLIPAFMISELRRAFEIGFLLFIPFLIIDMVVASILMSMGMMMLPPVIISLPFKLIFFVMVDGWYLIAGSLVESFGR
ncbi:MULTISPECIES: flagellar type III secretion system pore protein FliP [Thalassospira]|jgi:flagellar biosynthetic protein FliP|uniref:flagellar type III secretion system pore protein FliP n=1 Tax=Thalassospira sp. TaxID=1912094 RepID=UPI000B1FE98E|nr:MULTISPECIES: flagellar type III secretion system pore protein FliP [Thalassospira]MBO6771787.1 flagellar type III secretion system pore protein FliP [Thalassospira sp.]MCC4238931.1 flagellar type III secretion system pore protein FliP [Thalassospira povalilytica]URK19616.1 flagellar type III secretion system pore protein FliP [Thalassospira sp. GO-4]